MGWWQEKANERRAFRQAKEAPEEPKHKSKKKHAKNFKLQYTNELWLRFGFCERHNYYEKESDAQSQADKLRRCGYRVNVIDLRDAQ